jgi:hypothetical protein
VAHDPEYIAARHVLLDALGALGAQRKAVVLVGGQAIYLRVGAGELAVAPFTSDGDLAVNPTVLDDEPILAEAPSASRIPSDGPRRTASTCSASCVRRTCAKSATP